MLVWLVGCAPEYGDESGAPIWVGAGGQVGTGGEMGTTGGASAATGGIEASGGSDTVTTGGSGGDVVATGGTLGNTGGSDAIGGSQSVGSLFLWSQTFTGTQALDWTVVETGRVRSVGWVVGGGECRAFGTGMALTNGFTGTITLDVPEACSGAASFADGGDLYYKDSVTGPSVPHAADPGGYVGRVAVLTVRKMEWHNNPSRYEYDYTWSFYY